MIHLKIIRSYNRYLRQFDGMSNLTANRASYDCIASIVTNEAIFAIRCFKNCA